MGREGPAEAFAGLAMGGCRQTRQWVSSPRVGGSRLEDRG